MTWNSTTETATAAAAALKAAYDRDGYVIVPGLLPARDDVLRAASLHAATLARANTWPYRRTVGRQFPPYEEGSDADVWGVQHLMHPDLPLPQLADQGGQVSPFVQWYTSDAVVRVACALLGCAEDDLQMELFNLLINPERGDFALRWHRDDVREDVTEDEERAALELPHYGVQWNTALFDDSCLYIVPGTHRTLRTHEQRVRSSTQVAPRDPFDMPGAVQVHLKVGESVFYNNNILHCAVYPCGQVRATLHACMGDARRGGQTRARNVLQHGLRWMCEPRFAAMLPQDGDGSHTGRARAMWEKLVEMEKGNNGKVEYSLVG